MSRSGQLNLSRTRSIPSPNEYILALYGEYGPWTFDETAATEHRGRWRQLIGLPESARLNVELGTGNGYHFAHRSTGEDGLIGFELKYKPLIQSIRRAVKAGARHARMVRYNAALADHIFSPGEIDDVWIHFPDPWEKVRSHKHRLIQDDFLSRLHGLQKPGSRVEFKTDSREYFDWSMARFLRSAYKISECSWDLHSSPYVARNYVTHFERIFARQRLPIHYAQLRR